jgi:hypothetical protein
MSNDPEVTQAAIEDYLAGMNDADFGALVARTRPPTDSASARASIGAKAGQLLSVPRTADGSPAGSWASSVAARQPQPRPAEPPKLATDPGYTGSTSLRYTPFTPPATNNE